MGKFQDDTLWRQARQAFQAGQLPQAQASCEKLLQRNSRNARALEMLGQIAYAQGFLEKAVSYVTTCARLRPRDPTPLVRLGEILSFQGKHREAVDRFERALRLRPDSPQAVAGKAGAYEVSGQRDKARAVLEPYVSAGRDTGEMAIVQARLDLNAKAYDAVIDLVRRHLDRGVIEGTILWHLCFLLGRALERSGRFDEAFAAYQQANAAIPAPFDDDAWRETTNQLIEAFMPERFAQLPKATNNSSLPIFIVGMPRSGSTLIETIIDAHPEAHGAGEFEATHFLIESIPLEIGSNLPYPACIEDFDPNDVDRLSRIYLDQLSALNPEARRITDKYLLNYRHLGLLAVLFPAGRIIHCKRHPLDICLSCYAMSLMPHAHPFASDLRDLGTVYLAYERLMHHWRDVLRIPTLEVPYEALVADQEPWTRRIIEFCGLEWDDRCLRFHEGGRVVQTASYDQVTQPVYSSSVG
ncbi:MAG: tetratricopeptide repeat-containing sulfotransferase family protein, partial [Planctomycetota bacterium]